MEDLLLPLHEVRGESIDYFGFTTGNRYYIVTKDVSGATTTISYWNSLDAAAYAAAIASPASVTYTQTFPVGQPINFDFLFGLL